MGKKLVSSILILLIITWTLFGVSLKNKDEENLFDSIPMLDAYYDDNLEESEVSFWDSCNVSLITISKGKPLYSWFGHTGLLVESPMGDIFFDYGTFSFSADNFIGNFIMGRLWFCCNAGYFDYDLAVTEQEGRGLTKIELPLDVSQKKAVINFLQTNAKQENRTYLYHHYNDNCATRIRDIINYTTHGVFKEWAQAQEGLTFRQEASRSLAQNRIVLWVLNCLQSGNIDKKASLWDQMFMPEILQKAVAAFYTLEPENVIEESGKYQGSPSKPQNNVLFSVVMALVLCLVSFTFYKKGHEKSFFIYSAIVDIVFGLVGCVLFFMMFFTNHDVTWFNENILFLNPLLLATGFLSIIAASKDNLVLVDGS